MKMNLRIILIAALSLLYCKEKHEHNHEAMSSEAASSDSVFQLNSIWQSDLAEKTSLHRFHGRIQVWAMVYLSCKNACPLITSEMKTIQSKIPGNIRAKTDFVLITIDPTRDTVKVFNAYAEKMKLPENWHFLRGSEADVREMAAVLGMKY